MQLDVVLDGKKVSAIDLNENIFAQEYNEGLVHQVVMAQMAGLRSGSKAQKSRGDVRGGGIKPWKQKGTGRARAGSIRSPLWRSGGVTFAARPRDYSQKVNKKMYRLALCSMLSELLRQGRLSVTMDWELAEPKTRMIKEKLESNQVADTTVLLVTAREDINLFLASRNLPQVAVTLSGSVDPLALISFEKVVFTKEAIQELEGRLA